MPEFSHLTPSGRRRILRSARVGLAWAKMGFLSGAFGLLAYSTVTTVVGMSAAPWLSTTISIVASLLVASGTLQVQLQMARLTMRAQIMNLLRGECVPVCLNCGYDQVGNASDRCPECGATIRVPEED